MTKQGKFQLDNFNKFHNGDLGSDLERIITTAEALKENKEELVISGGFIRGSDYPFVMSVGESSYWYGNKRERDSDMNKLNELVTKFLTD